jgi:DNA-binding Lrp family transcriptional regulator
MPEKAPPAIPKRLREGVMVTAFVLIHAKRDRIPETAEVLTKMDGVAEVYSVAGEYDLIAVIRVKTNEQLADLVAGHLLKLDGIARTETLIAFRAYSKFDLERMFAIGMEE